MLLACMLLACCHVLEEDCIGCRLSLVDPISEEHADGLDEKPQVIGAWVRVIRLCAEAKEQEEEEEDEEEEAEEAEEEKWV